MGAATEAHAARNYLVVVVDDLGVDKVSTYQADYPTGNVLQYAKMDTLDSLATSGIRFTRGWSNPVCVPTRASFHTGVHPSRHGLGQNLDVSERGLDPDAWVTLGDVFSANGYETGYFGKWQVGNEDAAGAIGYPFVTPYTVAPHPARSGFADFDGSLTGIGAGGGYNNWERLTWTDGAGSGTYAIEAQHPTAVLAESAAAWIASRTGPFLAVVGFQAPHASNEGGVSQWKYGDADPTCYRSASLSCLATESCADEALSVYQALAECVDVKVEALLEGMDPAVLDQTTVVFVGDNGTPLEQLEGSFRLRNRGKGSVFESGVRVPFVVADGKTWRTGAAGVISGPGRNSTATVSTTDLYATLVDDAFDLTSPSVDSRSFAACLTNTASDCGFGSQVGYAEVFSYTDRGMLKSAQAAMRSNGSKVMFRYIPKQNCVNVSGVNTDTDPYELGKVTPSTDLKNAFVAFHDQSSGWADNLAFCP